MEIRVQQEIQRICEQLSQVMLVQQKQSQVTAEIQAVTHNVASAQHQTAYQIEAHQRAMQHFYEKQLATQQVASQAASHAAQAVQVVSAAAASSTSPPATVASSSAATSGAGPSASSAGHTPVDFRMNLMIAQHRISTQSIQNCRRTTDRRNPACGSTG